MSKQPAVALELNGCIDGDGPIESCKPKLGLKTAVDSLVDSGCYVLVHSVLVSDDLPGSTENTKRIEQWLVRWNIAWDSIWIGSGKPHASHYIETFEQLKKLVKELKSEEK